MKLNIETPSDLKIDFKTLNKSIEKHFISRNTKRHNPRQDTSIDVHFLDKDRMIELNKRYRDKDYLTDVLSFSYLDDLLEHETLAGEIFVSLEKAEVQSQEKQNNLQTEILYLIAHGYLHITGYLHDTDEQEQEMNDEEDWILNQAGNHKINR